MRALFFLLLGVVVAAAAAEQLPTYGSPDRDTIRVLVYGHGIERPGYYHLVSRSLATFVKEDRPGISRHVDDVRIQRGDGDSAVHYRIRVKALKSGDDFVLREGDRLTLITTII